MRRRLLLLILPLLALLLVALEAPLAESYAQRLSQQLFVERLGDADRFAALADQTLRNGNGARSLRAELRRYGELYDSRVAVLDANRRVVLASDPGPLLSAASARRVLALALAGRSPEQPATIWPWRERPYVIAQPIGRDSQVLGAVAIVAPTHAVGDLVARRLGVLALAGLGVLVLTTLGCALPLAGWVLRPVRDLAGAVQLIGAGHLDGHVREDDGPPELRGLAAAFNRMTAGVGRALERQRAFASDASHELRNPLTALSLRMESLAPHVSATGRPQLDAAQEETARLSATVDRLLHLAQAEAAEAELRTIDAAAVARARVREWRPAYATAGTVLVVRADGEIEARCADGVLDEALDALLDNALRYAQGAPVEVSVERCADAVELTVRDRGDGLGADELEAAGERLWRSPRHQNIPGTGLGLAIVRTLLDATAGTLELRDAAPGLAAIVRLPAAASALSGATGGTSGPRRDAAAAASSLSLRADSAAPPPDAPAPARPDGGTAGA